MRIVRTEAIFYIAPGKISVIINDLSKENPVYSFSINGLQLAIDYETSLRKPVFEYNSLMGGLRDAIKIANQEGKDTSMLQTKLDEYTKKCFGVPKKFIKENPNSELCIEALKMMGKGDPTVPDGTDELRVLFASLAENIRDGNTGKDYQKTLDKLSLK